MLGEALDLGEGEELVHSGHHGELFGVERVEARSRERGLEFLPEFAPAAVDEAAGVDLGGVQKLVHFGRFTAERAAEGVTQGMRRVGRDHERLPAPPGQCRRRRRGQRGLADTPLPVNSRIRMPTLRLRMLQRAS